MKRLSLLSLLCAILAGCSGGEETQPSARPQNVPASAPQPLMREDANQELTPSDSAAQQPREEESRVAPPQPTWAALRAALLGREEIPNDVEYTIIDETTFLDYKRSLQIRLNRRVSKGILHSIALKLKNSDPNTYDRTFIEYYLPDMKLSAGCWATTHFRPSLEVGIHGLTEEEYKYLTKEAMAPIGDNVIGRWLDEKAIHGVITLLKEDGKVFMTYTLLDGGKLKYEMVVRKVGTQIRYSMKDSRNGDYMIINEYGDLVHGNDDEGGIWDTSTRIK